MALTPSDFKASFPEFTNREDDLIQGLFVEASGLHSATERGTFLAVAHLLELDSDELAGEVTTAQVGEVTTSTLPSSEDGRDAFFTRTIYGQRLLAQVRGSTDMGLVFV